MKRFILAYFATAFLLSVGVDQTHAQIFRRVCPTGSCPYSATYRVAPSYQRVYSPYSYAQSVAPCEQATETVDAPEPCAPVETVEPCAPVQTCAPVEYLPECAEAPTVETTTVDGCVGDSCPIRTAAKATVQTVRNVAATTRFLLAANRIRAQYGLAALRADANLDAGCESQARICQSRGALIHGGGSAEILAYNWSGFDAALVQWLNSPGHRALLLGNFRTAGVAVVRGADGRVWCAMRFR